MFEKTVIDIIFISVIYGLFICTVLTGMKDSIIGYRNYRERTKDRREFIARMKDYLAKKSTKDSYDYYFEKIYGLYLGETDVVKRMNKVVEKNVKQLMRRARGKKHRIEFSAVWIDLYSGKMSHNLTDYIVEDYKYYHKGRSMHADSGYRRNR